MNNGLIIRSNLSFTVKLGACKSQKSKLTNAGIDCGNRRNLNQSIRLLTDRTSPQYIANTVLRNKAITNLKQSRTEILQDAKKARAALKNPEVIKSLGKATVQRLSKLSDEELALEVINASEQVIEERIFIPKADNFRGLSKIRRLQGNTPPSRLRWV